MVLAACFFSLLFNGFGQYNAGVMKVVLLRHLHSDVTVTTWLTSYYAGAFALTGWLMTQTLQSLALRPDRLVDDTDIAVTGPSP